MGQAQALADKVGPSHRDACPFCGGINSIKTNDMKLCSGCSRSMHRACEEQMRGQTHPDGLCILCEIQALLRHDNKVPAHVALKRLPTMLNYHIFNYKHFFGGDGAPKVLQLYLPSVNAQEEGGGDRRAMAERRESKSAQGIRIFRESLGLNSSYSSLSELFSAMTYVPPHSAGNISMLASSLGSSSPSGPWGGEHWPVGSESTRRRPRESEYKVGARRNEQKWSIREESENKWGVKEEKSQIKGKKSMITAEKSQSAGSMFPMKSSAEKDSWPDLPASSLSDRHMRFEQVNEKQLSPGRGSRVSTSNNKSSLQELMEYNDFLRSSKTAQSKDSKSAVRATAARHLDITSPSSSNATSPKDSPNKLFSWDRRARTASDALKMTLQDPAPHGVPHPVKKFLSPRANAAYVQNSPRLRTHFLGISPRFDSKQTKQKIDCWRETDRRRIETSRSLPLSASEQLEQMYRSTLNHVHACGQDFKRPQTSEFPWKYAVKPRPPSEEQRLKSGRGIQRGKLEIQAGKSVYANHLPEGDNAEYRVLDSRARKRGIALADKVSSSATGRKNTARESEFISNGNSAYAGILQFINGDLEQFGNDILDMCQSDYTPHQFYQAVHKVEYHRREEGEPSPMDYESDSSFDSVVAQFEAYEDALHNISTSLANKLYLLHPTHGVKLKAPQAMLIVMHEFGIFPTLLGTRKMMSIVLQAITDCVNGFPESETRRFQNILESVILDVALTVFREDPENLGVGQVIDTDAPDSHLLQVLLVYMKLDQKERMNAFSAKFLTPREAEEQVVAMKNRTKHRHHIALNFAGQSDPIQRTILKWQRPLQDIFHFFAAELEEVGWSMNPTSPTDTTRRLIHFSREMPSKDELTEQNESKVNNLQEKRLQLLQTLNIGEEKDKNNGDTQDDRFTQRWALQRVRVLVAHGKIDRTEAAYLAQCLAEKDALHDPELLRSQKSTDFLAQAKKKRDEKARALSFLLQACSPRMHLVVDDFVPFCNQDVATARILFDCVKKKTLHEMETDEFLASWWTDGLCENILEHINLEYIDKPQEDCKQMQPETMHLPVSSILGKAHNLLVKEQKVDGEANVHHGHGENVRAEIDWISSCDAALGEVHDRNFKVDSLVSRMLDQLNEEVCEFIGRGQSRLPATISEDDVGQMESSFNQRLNYQDAEFVDLSDDYLKSSGNASVHWAVSNNDRLNGTMLRSFSRTNSTESVKSHGKSHGRMKRTVSPESAKSTGNSIQEPHLSIQEPHPRRRYGSISFLSCLASVKKRMISKINLPDGQNVFSKDDDIPERCISPYSAIGAGAIFKLAEVFGWIGTAEEVKTGVALMQDVDLYEHCLRLSKKLNLENFKFQLNWNGFLDLLIDVACNCVKKCHVNEAQVYLDDTTSAHTEGLFYFMGLPSFTMSKRGWLKDRVHDAVRFRLYHVVDQPAPATLWLLPPVNKPWRDGLHLNNDFHDIIGEEFKRLLNGQPSRHSPADSWARVPCGQDSPLGRVPSLSSPNLSRAGSLAEDPSSYQSWFVIMFCDSTNDEQHDKNSQIFQALAWRHPWRFFRMDLSIHSSSKYFLEENAVPPVPCLRLYCVNGFYRDYQGYWDVGTMDYWVDEQGIPDDAKDDEHMLHHEKKNVVEYFEVSNGLGAYMDACLSLSHSRAKASRRLVYPIKDFLRLLDGKALELNHLDLSGPEAFALAHCLKYNRKLRIISLENCRLQVDGLVAILLALALNTKVKVLNLSCNLIGIPPPAMKAFQRGLTMHMEPEQEELALGKPMEALSNFVRCNTSLEQLRLRSCGLNDLAVKAMSASLCTNFAMPLALCDLSENYLGDASVAALVNLRGGEVFGLDCMCIFFQNEMILRLQNSSRELTTLCAQVKLCQARNDARSKSVALQQLNLSGEMLACSLWD